MLDLAEDASRWLSPEVELLPDVWAPAFVGRRLVEAYAILARIPRERSGPRGHGCGMPAYVHDVPRKGRVWSEQKGRYVPGTVLPDPDHEGWMYQDPPQETIARPTGAELVRMDVVLAWPGRFLAHDAELSACVANWAAWTARDLDVDELADRFFYAKSRTFQAKRREGLRLIARGLNEAGEGVV